MIDEGLSGSWPEEVKAALEGFELGSLIERPPIVFPRNPDHPLWEPASGAVDGPTVEVPEGDCPPFGIITSQTCDVNEERPNPQKPWVQVSPVYELEGDKAGNARHIFHLYELNGPDLPSGRWFVDLRLEVPLEKSALVGRTPLPGFATERDTVRFAERLGRRRDRAALASQVNSVLDQTLRAKINKKKSEAREHYEKVHGVYLEISEGSRSEPELVGIHIISKAGELPEEIMEWFQDWWDAAAEAGETSEPALALQAIMFHDGAAMDLSIYEDLIPIERRP